MKTIVLKPGRDKSLHRRHPWIFSGAVARIDGLPQSGETVTVLSSDGKRLALGAYSPQSQIGVRVWSFDPDDTINQDFFRHRIQRAMGLRQALNIPSSAYRIVNSESDGLPGVIIDRYGEWIVCQFLSAGAEYWKSEIVRQLNELIPNSGIYERSDVDIRAKEGLGWCTGVICGNTPPEQIAIEEAGLRFWVDITKGHKTGFYLDQRLNRAISAEYVSGAEVLNCFAYTGGFGMYALKAGASKVINVESSASALELARRNMEINGIDTSRMESIVGDVFQILRQYRDSRRQFDYIILDPPKFADSKTQVERASRGYKDINLLAFKLLRPGGRLVTFSCSGMVSEDLFQKIVADAAIDAKQDAVIVRKLSQAADHPVSLNFPEAHYLKGLLCRVG